jgi:hypothetical protein
MAQTTTIPSDDEAVVTDDIGTNEHVQFVKLAIGTAGSATPIPSNGTDGLLVNLGANNDVTVTGTVTATATDLDIRPLVNTDVVTAELSAVDNAVLDTIDAVLDTIKTDTALIVTSVQTLDNAVSGNEFQVDVLTMPTTTVQATNLDIRDLTNADVVTAELSAVDNAVLDAIAASLATLDNVVASSACWQQQHR